MLVTFDENSRIVRVKLLDSTSTTGAGKTGLTSASAGLIISTIADVEATPTAYTQAGGTIETVATLGTYAAPTATKCRFKEVDATNHPGLYELQFADARMSVASAKELIVSIHGAAGLAQGDLRVELSRFDIQTAKQAVSLAAADVSGNLPADVVNWKGAVAPAMTGDAFARLGAPAGADVSTDIAAVKAQAAAIEADTQNIQTRLPADLVAGRMDSSMGAIAAGVRVNTSYALRKNATLAAFPFVMIDSADHLTPKTGLTVTAQRSIDGGAFAACANAVAEIGNGVYKIDLAAADLNGDTIILRFTASGADASLLSIVTQS